MTQGFNEQSVLSDVVLPAALQQYQLRGLVAREHGGQVFAAWDTQLCRDVWIRRIHHQGENATQILNEARLAAALKHPAFAKIHALEESDEYLFVIGEAILGLPLLEWVGQNQGNQKAIFDLTVQIASALAEAHQMGLVHGDIQAKQFLIDASRQVRILNCGFVGGRSSAALSSIDQIDSSSGLAYFAPERFANAAATPASDVYALGTLLYQMFNGSLPFVHLQGLAMVAAMVQADAEQWPCRDEVSPALREWMLAMLKRQPEQRISCLEIVEQGRVIREAEGYSSTNSSINLQGLQGQLAELARRKKRNRILGAACLLLLIAGGVWQAKPDWQQLAKVMTPYSESRELEQGMLLLEEYAQLTKQDQLDRASEHIERVLERTPEKAEAVAAMAYIYFQRYQSGQRDEVWMQKAKASTQQALKLDASLAMTQVVNARLLQWQHELPKALAAAELSIRIAPKGILGWHTKMSILLEMGRQDEAIEFAQEAEKLFPKDRYVLDLAAGIYLAKGRFAEVESILKKSLERQPEGRLAYPLMAVALMRQGRDNEAMQYLQRGLEVFPSPNLYGTLGDIRLYQGEYEDAADAYEKSVSTKNGVAGSYLRWLSFAEALHWTKSRKAEEISAFEKARSLLEIRIRRSPDDAFLALNMAHILFRLGDRSAALDSVSRLKKQDLMNETGLLKLAQMYELLGDRDAAIECLIAIKEMGVPVDDRHPIFQELRKAPQYQQRLSDK